MFTNFVFFIFLHAPDLNIIPTQHCRGKYLRELKVPKCEQFIPSIILPKPHNNLADHHGTQSEAKEFSIHRQKLEL